MILKSCPDCGQMKALEEFPPAVRRRDGRSTYCKVCMRDRSKASYRRRAEALGRAVRVSVEVPEGHRQCPDCSRVLPLTAFCRNKADKKHGRATYCKECHNARSREVRARLYGGGRHYHLKRRYGLSAEEVDAMIAEQGGMCAVCARRPAEHVDHDHATGQVRGVLCSGCNQGLGNFRDEPDALRAAALYLEGNAS